MIRPSDDILREILTPPASIAVVGASPNPARPSNWISTFLISAGFMVTPVNPGHEELFGLTCYPDVASIPHPVDVVNIFRRSDQVLPAMPGILSRADIALIWMQDGVVSPEAAELASSQGVHVVMDDCIYRYLR